MTGRGGSSGARNGGEKGEARPGAHPELAGGVSLAGGRPVVANLAAAVRRSGEGIDNGDGFSGRLGSIPSTGRARRRWRSFSAHRWRLGRRETAALPSGHGGGAGVLGGGRERKGE
jgi:hypothetical protein